MDWLKANGITWAKEFKRNPCYQEKLKKEKVMKVGDLVERIDPGKGWNGMLVGDKDTIIGFDGECITLKNFGSGHMKDYFKVIEKNSYHFRGTPNYSHLINDCIKDGKQSFVLVEKDSTTIGVTKQLPLSDFAKMTMVIKDHEDTHQTGHLPFLLYRINKEDTHKAIKWANKVPAMVAKGVKKIARDIHKKKKKGEFSNKPVTKVMVY